MPQKMALKVEAMDNVATIFADEIRAGDILTVRDKSGKDEELKVLEAIPYGHKIALSFVAKGEPIIKYGECIGAASTDIAKGAYIHIHNMEALRGRGDRQRK